MSEKKRKKDKQEILYRVRVVAQKTFYVRAPGNASTLDVESCLYVQDEASFGDDVAWENPEIEATLLGSVEDPDLSAMIGTTSEKVVTWSEATGDE